MANITLEVYLDNKLVLTDNTLQTDNDGNVTYNLSTTNLAPTLTPYVAIFREQNGQDYFMRRIFLMTPVMLKALEELRTYLDRLNRQMRVDSLKFSDTDYIAWLQSGRDHFNAIGKQTNISMINAQGAIYSFWLKCAEIIALRVKYLEEGLTSFNYSGSAVQLDIDVTQFIDGLLSKLEGEVDQHLPPLKEQLYRNGITNSDGSQVIPAGYARGATGLTISPVTGSGYLRTR